MRCTNSDEVGSSCGIWLLDRNHEELALARRCWLTLSADKPVDVIGSWRESASEICRLNCGLQHKVLRPWRSIKRGVRTAKTLIDLCGESSQWNQAARSCDSLAGFQLLGLACEFLSTTKEK